MCPQRRSLKLKMMKTLAVLTVRSVQFFYVMTVFTENTYKNKYKQDKQVYVKQLKLIIILTLEYLDQILSTAVDVEHDNDDDTNSTDGTVCKIILCNESFYGKYCDSQIYGQPK